MCEYFSLVLATVRYVIIVAGEIGLLAVPRLTRGVSSGRVRVIPSSEMFHGETRVV